MPLVRATRRITIMYAYKTGLVVVQIDTFGQLMTPQSYHPLAEEVLEPGGTPASRRGTACGKPDVVCSSLNLNPVTSCITPSGPTG